MAVDERYARVVGEFAGDEEQFATEGTTAGHAQGVLSITPGPNGIIIDYVQTRDEGRFVAHGVVAGDGFWWFDTAGFVPERPGVAGWQDDLLVLDRSSERGRTVMGLHPVDGGLALTIATATADDPTLKPLLSGRYTRR